MTSETTFAALVVRKGPERTFVRAVERRTLDDLPVGEVLIRVHCSTINFKDRMSAAGHPAITRRFPHTPGVDAAGVVVASDSVGVPVGSRVAVISHAMGMNMPGGFGQYVRVPAAWVMPLDEALSFEEAMAFGTPGYTAALAVEALIAAGIHLDGASVVVTGATGGLGALSVAFLAALGVRVTAVTGRPGAGDFLTGIGAAEIVARSAFEDTSGRNLLTPEWDAGVDIAGGTLLATMIRRLKDGGAVAATGMAQDTALATNVLPFILRGVRLLGINAENTDMVHRQALWHKMATIWKPTVLPRLCRVITLADLPDALDPGNRDTPFGRLVVDLR